MRNKLLGVIGTIVAVVLLIGAIATIGIALSQFATPIEDGTYTGQKIDYSHQRGIIFETNDLTTKTNDRSSTTEDWCVADNNDELVQKVRNIEDGQRIKLTYHRPLWIWPDTCEGGLKVIDSIQTVNATS
jgi:hypothetical protein